MMLWKQDISSINDTEVIAIQAKRNLSHIVIHNQYMA